MDLPDPAVVEGILRARGCWWPRPHVVTTTGSTNADALESLKSGADTGLCVVAGEQTAGRGRRGRSWVSDPGAGLWSSTVVRDYPQPARLPLLASLAVVDAAVQIGGPVVHVKWPNDVLADDGRKLAGILVEAAAREPSVGSAAGGAAVVGIGINVNHPEESLPAPGATSWRIAHSVVPDRSTLLAELLVALNNRLTTEWSRCLTDYRRWCRTLGTGVVIDLPGGNRIEGRALDVDDEGHLLVDDGESPRTIVAGDVVHATIRT
ncbi:MAG: biotin--[acetyl-CoA-carboxylase] ligase [Actinomycetales bacterium]|nr:biotin--[acetyl-CoA-carboxylase] ligase [Actinomycetales bacterium]